MKFTLPLKEGQVRLRLGWTLMAAWMMMFPLLGIFSTVETAQAAALQLDPNMDKTWKRTDLFVAQGTQPRSWLWGPTAFSIIAEEYDGSPASGEIPNNRRLVAYYDKSRMEINNPNGDRNSKYFVTNGLLVKELISGRRAFGDTRTVAYLSANVPVAGDGTGNEFSPTYASLQGVASLRLDQNRASNRTGQLVTSYLERDKGPSEDLRFNSYNVTNVQYDNTFGHNVPKVFWDFMNSTGKVLENGQTVDGPVVDWLFSTGYPIMEAYWTKTTVGGQSKDVLLQCFERRCLTYTPSNSSAFQIEMGNVGRHYYEWRYNSPAITCQTNPIRGFGKVWSENPTVKQRLYCPSYKVEQAATVAIQKFERGMMIRVETSKTDYSQMRFKKNIFILFNNGDMVSLEDTWASGQPESGNLTPPAGRFEPTRGFGKAWRNETGLKLRERLGWAVEAAPRSGNGAWQAFYYGLMIYLGPTKEIVVGYRYYSEGTWEIYKDTFTG